MFNLQNAGRSPASSSPAHPWPAPAMTG